VCKTSHMRHQSGPGAPGGWRARRGKRLDGPQHNAADIGEQGHLRGPLRRAWSSNRWQQVKLRQPGTGQPSGLVGCPPGGDGPRRFRGAGPAGAGTRFRAHCRLCMARQTRRSPTPRSRSCRECCGNSLAACSEHVKVRFLRRRGQGASVRGAERGFPSHRPCASGSGRRRAAPRAASARSRRRAARSGS
jgi:hypothetical protein